MSYLNEWDIVYPLAGKFAALIHLVVSNDAVAFRLFNVGLFLVLALVALFPRNEILAYALLLTSPQIWYTFSYFNGDAFPMFVCFVAAGALVAPTSRFNDQDRSTFARYLPLAVCIGLLVLSKKTFWAFGLFAAYCAAWIEYPHDGGTRALAQFAGRMVFFAGIILLTAFPRIAYDIAINGGPARKAEKILETANATAMPTFRPSSKLKSTMNLKGKGIGIIDMMKPPYSWAKRTAESAFGSYNYNCYFMWPRYYAAMYTAFAVFIIYLAATVSMFAGLVERAILGGALVFSALVVGLSIHSSWVSDLQPQGRYLFAIFPMLAVVLVRNKYLLNPLFVNLFLSFCFAASSYSFIAQGLIKSGKYRDIAEITAEFQRPK